MSAGQLLCRKPLGVETKPVFDKKVKVYSDR